MPSATPKTLINYVENILKINPRTVLEVGIGFGRNAFLLREYIESWQDRTFPDQWEMTIEGVEIFEEYTKLPWMEHLYNNITVKDAAEYFLFSKPKKYDLTVCTDVLEHLEKEKGLFVGQKLIESCTKACIINVPTGDQWMNNVVIANNPAEQHQSIWEEVDLKNLAITNNVKVDLFPWSVSNTKGGCLAIYKKA